MSFNVISFLKSALANQGAVPVADNNPLPISQYIGGAVVSASNPLPVSGGVNYETVAASQSDQIMGATGAVGDYLDHVVIVPGTTAAGAVSIKDGNGSSISLFVGGGTTALIDLAPKIVFIGAKCVNATTPGWKITTGANVTAIGFGSFT